jgi:hypothetical protein
VSTRATEAIFHASQGGVARTAQAHGKRGQPAELGKIASAGFAQIFGEQVAKSTARAETDEKPGQGFTPHDVSTSSPHAPTQALPKTLPHTLTQPTPIASEKTTPQVLAQVRLERGTLSRQGTNPGVLPRQGGKATQTVGQETQPVAINPRPSFSAARPASSATNAQQSKPATATIPTTRVGSAVYKFAGQTENPAKQTMAPACEEQSKRPAQAQVAQNNTHATDKVRVPVSTLKGTATPTKSTETVKSVQLSAQPIETVSPQPVVRTEVSPSRHESAHEGQDLARESTAAQPSVNLAHPPSLGLTSTPIREQIPVQIPAANRVTTKASEAAAIIPAKADGNTVRVPVQTGDASVHATVQTSPTVAPAKSITRQDPTRSPSTSPFLPEVLDAMPAPRQAHPVAQSPTAKPTEVSKDHASVDVAPEAQELPRAVPAAATSTTAPAFHKDAFANLAPQPAAHDLKGNTPVQGHARTGQHTVAEVTPPQAEKPENRPASPQAPEGTQAPSISIPQPGVATVAQEASAPHVTRNPEPASRPQEASPITPAKINPRAAVARPTTGHAGVLEETTPTQSAPEVKTPEPPSANQVVTSSENPAHAITDKPALAGPKPAEASPTPGPGHVEKKGPVRVESVASKRRARVEDETEHKVTNTEQAQPSRTNLQSSYTSPTEGIEVKASKPEAPQPTEHRISTETSSQSSSAQSPAGQPHTAKEVPPTPVLPNTARATVLVSPTTILPATSEAGVRQAPAPTSAAAETAGLVDQAVGDPGLSVTVMPHSAHLSIASDAGDLSLHVRVRDGSADVNVSGSMASLFDTKAPEMRTALAGEGLQLGSFATDQRGGSQGQQGQPESAPRTHEQHPMPTLRRTNTATPEIQIAADRRIHVTA